MTNKYSIAEEFIILEALRGIQERVDSNNLRDDDGEGICWHTIDWIEEHTTTCYSESPSAGELSKVWAPYFESWEFFSGDLEYPVEGCSEEYSNNNFWTGKYSEKRKHLLDHLVFCMEDDLEGG